VSAGALVGSTDRKNDEAVFDVANSFDALDQFSDHSQIVFVGHIPAKGDALARDLDRNLLDIEAAVAKHLEDALIDRGFVGIHLAVTLERFALLLS
jgi:hypothetical protein